MPSMDFERLDWEDYPSTATPLSADNLNRLEDAMEGIYDDVGDQEDIIENILGNFAHVESTGVATKDYEQGEMLVLGDYLYKATAPIYTDETLVEDGNIVRTTISNEYGTDVTFNFADVEYSTIASKSHAPGSYIVLDDVLYRVTVLIVAGNTIAEGTNVEQVTVGGELTVANTGIQNIFGDFATVEPTDTASKAYSVNAYLVYNNEFYRVTAAIAQGDTIVPDTNVVKTTVGDEIKSVRNTSDSSYCKMPDGTLMEWGVKSVTTSAGHGPLGYFGSATVQFSPVFSSAPMATASVSEHAGYWTATVYGVAADAMTVMIAGDVPSVTRNVYWHAIGRWK